MTIRTRLLGMFLTGLVAGGMIVLAIIALLATK